jgi:hypothetical protein
MTRGSLGWIVAGVVVVLSCTLGAMQQEGAVGRYQLFEGRSELIAGATGKVLEQVSVWRIDTVNGRVDRYTAVVGGPNEGFGWQSVGDYRPK